MSGLARRAAFTALHRPLFRPSPVRYFPAGATSSETDAERAADRQGDRQALAKGARRDPELIILLVIMSGVFGLAGWHFSSSPTSASSESATSAIKGSEPWNSGAEGKYMYHPGGDKSAQPRSAPSALNTVIVPNVTLPKELHEKYNKYGKEEY